MYRTRRRVVPFIPGASIVASGMESSIIRKARYVVNLEGPFLPKEPNSSISGSRARLRCPGSTLFVCAFVREA